MSDYYEVDFIDVPSSKGGDAITIRYCINNKISIHVVDAGYQDTGDKIINHIKKYYDNPQKIDNVVLTHQDNDHAGGLRKILEDYDIGKLWMLRPWLYTDVLLPRFSRFSNPDNLAKRLREIYPNIAALEEIAERKNIKIDNPFQGTQIGCFTVLSPTKEFYLDLVVNSEKTPEALAEESLKQITFSSVLKKALSYIKKTWGIETFSEEETTCENEMSIVQYAKLCNENILLTGDAGRRALSASIDYLSANGFGNVKMTKFQVPHHGSRRNLSSNILNSLLGPKLSKPLLEDTSIGIAMISASKDDDDHPRKVTVRSLIHRGYKVIVTKGRNYCVGYGAPPRYDYGPISGLPYPEDEETE